MMTPMRRILLAGVAVLVLAVAGGAWRLAERVKAPFQGYGGGEQFVDLPRGSSPQAIGHALVASGVIRDPLVFRVALWQSGSARQLKAGEYRFDRPMTPREVIDTLVRGDVFMRSITFPEGLTVRQMAEIYEARGFGPGAAFAAAASKAELVAELDAEARDLEGYLFPETYALSRHASAGQLVSMMVARFRAVVDAGLIREAADRGLSARQVVTLASIVEKETARPEERPLVAAVYLRRLRLRMALQSDPTVLFALARARRPTTNLTKDHLTFNSPYNTYRYPGLPPGPIAAPGRRAIEAVVRAPETDFLYFVSRNDGSHVFARDLGEHNRNVQRYQVQFFKQNRLQGQRSRQAPSPAAGAREPAVRR